MLIVAVESSDIGIRRKLPSGSGANGGMKHEGAGYTASRAVNAWSCFGRYISPDPQVSATSSVIEIELPETPQERNYE